MSIEAQMWHVRQRGRGRRPGPGRAGQGHSKPVGYRASSIATSGSLKLLLSVGCMRELRGAGAGSELAEGPIGLEVGFGPFWGLGIRKISVTPPPALNFSSPCVPLEPMPPWLSG